MNEPYFMTYYKNIALLSGLFNKESLFFSHMLSMADKNLIVNMTKFQKESIVKKIGSKTKNPSNLARQYISKIQSAGLIARVGGGSYKINPMINGFSASSEYLEKHRHDYAEIKIRMRANGDVKLSSSTGEIKKDDDGKEYVITSDGDKTYF